MAKSEAQIRDEVYEEFNNVNKCAKLFFEIIREETNLKQQAAELEAKRNHYDTWRKNILDAGGKAADLLKEATSVSLMQDSPLTQSEVKSSGFTRPVKSEDRRAASKYILDGYKKSKKIFIRKDWEKEVNGKLDVECTPASYNALWKELTDSKTVKVKDNSKKPFKYEVTK